MAKSSLAAYKTRGNESPRSTDLLRKVDCAGPECHASFAKQLGRGFEPCSLLCGQRVGVEAKRTIAPAMTRSLHPAPSDLRLDRAFVLIPGEARFGCTSAWRRWG